MTVYYLRAKNGAIKIGYTQSLSDRLSALSTSSPLELELVAQEEGGLGLERQRHEEYKDHRIRGEWFCPCDALNQRITKLSPGYKPLSYVDADDYYLIKRRLDSIIGWVATDRDDPPKIIYLVAVIGLLVGPAVITAVKYGVAHGVVLDESTVAVASAILSPVCLIMLIGYILVKVWQFRTLWKSARQLSANGNGQHANP